METLRSGARQRLRAEPSGSRRAGPGRALLGPTGITGTFPARYRHRQSPPGSGAGPRAAPGAPPAPPLPDGGTEGWMERGMERLERPGAGPGDGGDFLPWE
ncbi:uncharacterized protein GJ701_012675 [Geothlypis trichas]